MLPRLKTTVKCLLLATLLACSLQPVCLYAQKVGDYVIGIRDTPVKDGDKVIGTFYAGQVSPIEDINGNWYWVSQSSAGWVRRQDVLPVADAIKYFTEQIRQEPSNQDAYYKRGVAWRTKGESDIALSDFNEAIRLDPTDGSAWNERGLTRYDKGQYDKSIADFTEAIKIEPTSVRYANRARSWLQKDDYDNALADSNEALRLDEEDVFALTWRGYCWYQKGKWAKAVADWNEVLRLDSKYYTPLFYLANLESSCPDESYRNGKQAVEHAKQACEVTAWKDATAVDALARAYAEMGDFDHAVEYQNKVLEMRNWKPKEGEKDWQRYRLELYQQKKPYRFDPDA